MNSIYIYIYDRLYIYIYRRRRSTRRRPNFYSVDRRRNGGGYGSSAPRTALTAPPSPSTAGIFSGSVRRLSKKVSAGLRAVQRLRVLRQCAALRSRRRWGEGRGREEAPNVRIITPFNISFTSKYTNKI